MYRPNSSRARMPYKEPERHCSCGGIIKVKQRRNFPHGRKSGGRTIKYSLCNLCQKRS